MNGLIKKQNLEFYVGGGGEEKKFLYSIEYGFFRRFLTIFEGLWWINIKFWVGRERGTFYFENWKKEGN